MRLIDNKRQPIVPCNTAYSDICTQPMGSYLTLHVTTTYYVMLFDIVS